MSLPHCVRCQYLENLHLDKDSHQFSHVIVSHNIPVLYIYFAKKEQDSEMLLLVIVYRNWRMKIYLHLNIPYACYFRYWTRNQRLKPSPKLARQPISNTSLVAVIKRQYQQVTPIKLQICFYHITVLKYCLLLTLHFENLEEGQAVWLRIENGLAALPKSHHVLHCDLVQVCLRHCFVCNCLNWSQSRLFLFTLNQTGSTLIGNLIQRKPLW